MSQVDEIRARGQIPYTGTCSDCGQELTPTLPATEEHAQNRGEYFRCICGHINYLTKASDPA